MKTFIKGQQYYLEISVTDEDGNFVNGLVVAYDIRNSSTNVSIQSGNLVGEGSIYKVATTISTIGQYRVLYITPDGYENSIEEILVVDAPIIITVPTKDEIADAVWDEPLASHLTGDKAGQHLEDSDAITDIDAIVDGVLNEDVTLHLGGHKVGQYLVDAGAVGNPTATAEAVWQFLSNGTGSLSMQEVLLRIQGLTQSNYRILNPVYIKVKGQELLSSATIRIYSNASDCTNNVNSIASYLITSTYDGDGKMQNYKVVEA